MADKILRPFGAFAAIGTVATPATGTIEVTENGGNQSHVTTLDIAGLSLLSTTNANKAGGALIYTLPAGNILITRSSLSGYIVGTGTANAADTPDVGLGTVIGSGSVATLDGTATFENILTGQTWGDCNSTVQQAISATSLGILSAAAHTIHLNAADGWAGVDAGMKFTGRIVIEWQYMS